MIFYCKGKYASYELCDGKEIKAMDCIIKVDITRGNITWRSFALRACTSKNKKRMATSASLCEGMSLTFQYLLLCKSQSYAFSFQPQLFFQRQASCGGERSIHIWPVKYIWSWIIIVDNYLYDKWVGRRNIKPLSFSVFMDAICSKNMLWVLAIIEYYMMIEYVELLVRLYWISWIAIAWWLRL